MNEYGILKNRVKDVQGQLDIEKERKKPNPNERMVENTPDIVDTYDFWCDECEKDFSSRAYKTVHRLYGDAIVSYRARCECGNECQRLVSHRDHDPYYARSEKVRRSRGEFSQDMLQPDQYGFNTLWR